MNARPQTNTTADDFADLAERIRMIADQYDSIATAMRARNITHLSVLGMDTLNDVTMLRMNGPLASAQRALATHKPTGSRSAYKVAEDPEKLRIDQEAKAANARAARRKKKSD
jgi:hypothetical protein